MPEKDFSRVMFKANVSGSWANICYCPADRYDEAKAACKELARCHGGSIRFKVVDADGGVIEQYGPTKPNGKTCWHEP
jgi:hypothetical protein